jgi:predicted ester cyclase
MENFASEFQTPEQYIIDITYRIWEERGIDRIREWYASEAPVRTPHGITTSVEAVVEGTRATLDEFPDRLLLPEDIIVGDLAEGFISSHRVRSTATHIGDGAFGEATNRSIMMLTIAECICRENQVVEEWLVRDQASMARQLGLNPADLGNAMGSAKPNDYIVGNEAFIRRWDSPEGLTILGDQDLADHIIQTYDAIWNNKNLSILDQNYDRAIRFEGPSGELHYGRTPTKHILNGFLSSIPDGRFEPHHAIIRQDPEKAIRAELRWSYAGSHSGNGRYGDPTGVPLTILGISHFELRDRNIVNEWFVIDETAIYAQIAAYQTEVKT